MRKALVHSSLVRIMGEGVFRECVREPVGDAGEKRRRSGQDQDKTD